MEASLLILSALAVVALLMARARPVFGSDQARRAAARALALALVAQSAHFAEEAATGLHERFPALLGLSPAPFSVFVLFNLAAIAIWAASISGLRSGRPGALVAAWFLAIAGLFNGIAHPAFAVASGGYFPGLVTCPFVAGAGALLWTRLRRATHPEGHAVP